MVLCFFGVWLAGQGACSVASVSLPCEHKTKTDGQRAVTTSDGAKVPMQCYAVSLSYFLVAESTIRLAARIPLAVQHVRERNNETMAQWISGSGLCDRNRPPERNDSMDGFAIAMRWDAMDWDRWEHEVGIEEVTFMEDSAGRSTV